MKINVKAKGIQQRREGKEKKERGTERMNEKRKTDRQKER